MKGRATRRRRIRYTTRTRRDRYFDLPASASVDTIFPYVQPL
jgi:hypothetical protein